jgi:Flp pilus assembly protein TadG
MKLIAQRIRACVPAIRSTGDSGQSLVIFAAGLIVFLGFVAMSVDVGRYMWARTQMQAAVDGASLAGAQSMPNKTVAEEYVHLYMDKNAATLMKQSTFFKTSVTFPVDSNKGVNVKGEAKVGTWFARFFGIDEWYVTAEGGAESQLLDIAVVLDISGSMCYDSYGPTESGGGYVGPGRTGTTPNLTSAIGAGQSGEFIINVTTTAPFLAPSNLYISGGNSGTPYWKYSKSGVRAGIIKINNEIFQITDVPSATTLKVKRALKDNYKNVNTVAANHNVGSELWMHRLNCNDAAYTTSGPFQPYDAMVDNAQYFVSLFNSGYDRIGLASFSTRGTIHRNLTSNLANVQSAIDAMGVPNGSTNIAHSIAVGRQILDGTGKRSDSIRILVVLTDGDANTWCTPNTYSASAYNGTSCSTSNGSDGDSRAVNHAIAEAQRAANGNITIYTIGLGTGLDQGFLQNIASIGGGKYYNAPTTAQLDEAFKKIADESRIRLNY